MTAVTEGNVQAASNILSTTAVDVNARNSVGDTVLQVAAMKGFLDIVQLIVREPARTKGRRQVDVDLTNNNGWSPLMVAAAGGYFPVVKFLVEEGKANVNLQRSVSGWVRVRIALPACILLSSFHRPSVLQSLFSADHHS